MPDSAVKKDSDSTVSAHSRRQRAEVLPSGEHVDTERKLARAARSAQRLAQLSEARRIGETLDLFAEDAERAHLQAMNTDIRQRALEGFELPDVFLQAVQSQQGAASSASVSPSAAGKRAAQSDAPCGAGPVQTSFQDVLADETGDASATPPAAVLCADASAPEPTPSDVLAATALVQDRVTDTAAPLSHARAEAAPELDRARVRAFSDTVDALHAVIVEQRASTAAHARRMKTMLTIIVGAMLVTVATGIAQTALLMRMRHDTQLQQDRTEQLMLNQQATLATLFDTDSANVAMFDPSRATAGAAPPVRPVSVAKTSAAARRHAHH